MRQVMDGEGEDEKHIKQTHNSVDIVVDPVGNGSKKNAYPRKNQVTLVYLENE
jgi:hypothetical protein